MEKGKVKWYNETKGYGFIESEKGNDIFIHRSGLSDTHIRLEPDQKVVYETKQGEKGMVAFNVKIEN